MPADGTSAAGGGTGDFGTSPILGQLSDKRLLACIWLCGVWIVKSNGGSKKYALIRVDEGVAAPFRCRSRLRSRSATLPVSMCAGGDQRASRFLRLALAGPRIASAARTCSFSM